MPRAHRFLVLSFPLRQGRAQVAVLIPEGREICLNVPELIVALGQL